MCGIAGVFLNCNQDAKPLGDLLTQNLQHRGPDEGGFWCEKGAFLGHTRLSIIGLDNGRQPFVVDDGDLICVVNGEVYNHKSLRKKFNLELASGSDCSVILPFIKGWG